MLKRVYLEITNACNLNCPFCENKKGNNFLSLEEIKNYCLQIKEFCDYIYLHILGEPTLHPDFNEILAFLNENDFKLQLVTNGTLLDKYPDILKNKCLRKLSISIHSINNLDVKDSYFETINKLIENNENKIIELRFYDFDNLSKKLNDYLNSLKEKYSLEITNKKNSYKLKENIYLYHEELFKWPLINDPIYSLNGTCLGAKNMIAINSNSDVSICCLDPYAYNYLGNLKKDKLKDILNSQKYQTIINDFNNRKINLELCKRCSYRSRFD